MLRKYQVGLFTSEYIREPEVFWCFQGYRRGTVSWNGLSGISEKWFGLYHCVKSVRIRSYSGPHFSRISRHSDWIRKDTKYLSVLNPNAGKWWKNADQNNSKYGHISGSVRLISEFKWVLKASFNDYSCSDNYSSSLSCVWKLSFRLLFSKCVYKNPKTPFSSKIFSLKAQPPEVFYGKRCS